MAKGRDDHGEGEVGYGFGSGKTRITINDPFLVSKISKCPSDKSRSGKLSDP
jgi:hypothetical protein